MVKIRTPKQTIKRESCPICKGEPLDLEVEGLRTELQKLRQYNLYKVK